MRTVEQIVKDFENGENIWMTRRLDWKHLVSVAKELEGNRFVVTDIYSNGVIRLKHPDWYKINPDNIALFESIIFVFTYSDEQFKPVMIRIGSQGIYVKVE